MLEHADYSAKPLSTKLKILSKMLANSNKLKIVTKTKTNTSLTNFQKINLENKNKTLLDNGKNLDKTICFKNYSIKPFKATKSGYIENIIQKKDLNYLNYYIESTTKNKIETSNNFFKPNQKDIKNDLINNDLQKTKIQEFKGNNLKEIIYKEEVNKKKIFKTYEETKQLIKSNKKKKLEMMLSKKACDTNKYKKVIKSSSFDFAPITQFVRIKERNKKKYDSRINEMMMKLDKGSFGSKPNKTILKDKKEKSKSCTQNLSESSTTNKKSFNKYIKPKVNSYHFNSQLKRKETKNNKPRHFSAKIKSAHFKKKEEEGNNYNLDETIKSWEKNQNSSFEEI